MESAPTRLKGIAGYFRTFSGCSPFDKGGYGEAEGDKTKGIQFKYALLSLYVNL